MLRQPLPLDARIEARRPITPELLAVAAGQPLELAVTYSERWFAVAHTAVESNLVLVFDDLVIGEPCPLLLEAVHHVRTTRRAERLGDFDDEEDRWYELHGDDDDDSWWEPPTITDRVLDAMAEGQEFDRLVDGAVGAVCRGAHTRPPARGVAVADPPRPDRPSSPRRAGRRHPDRRRGRRRCPVERRDRRGLPVGGMRVWPTAPAVIPSYTRGVKTAVSIPDPIFEAADRLARRRRISRSALYAEALELLLAGQADADAEITRRLDEVYADQDSTPDPLITAANAALWREVEW